MKLRPVSAAILLLLSSLTLAHAADVRRPYIVQLTDKPIASYNGEVSGLKATQPAPGRRLDLASGEVQLYTDYLDQKQATVKAVVANAPITYTYNVVLNGFAAMLTDDEVRALQLRSDVAAISADVPQQLTTSYTPAFLGLDKPDGLWSKLGGKGMAGENIIIGIVDGGVWPENPAYADRVDSNGKPTFDNSGTLVYTAPPAGWKEKENCQTGEGFTVGHCNNKLIGAQYFDESYLAEGKTTDWTEFKSPRDSLANAGWGGHGTHTSSTAGGNADVAVTVSNVSLGAVSGMAPRARLAMYKVCWSYLDASEANGVTNRCYGADSVMAIEKAVKDGVHVLNYSIGGGNSVTDPVAIAFMTASNAGVFVAASAGNSGPANTVAHVSPWITTVAASTHNRTYVGDATLGNGTVLTGASNNASTASAALILASEAGLPGADPLTLSRCYGASDGGNALLDPAKVSGKLLVCDRGGNVLVNKSASGKAAGATGVIIANVSASNNTTIVQPHSLSTVHITVADGTTLKSYMAANPGTAVAALGNVRSVANAAVAAPVITGFSSRGPNKFDPNVLKPDLTAPGADILAGATPALTQGEHSDIVNGTLVPPAAWSVLQGTSMSSPHVAGLAALLKQQYPSWTPAAIKSALMTTGYNTLPDGITDDTRGTAPFGQGAGHVNPNAASDPGLVYDATQADYRKYLCGVGITAQCASSGGQILPYNLNLPSISVGNVLGSVVVTRSVTNVGNAAATYTSSIAVPGYSAVVNPSSLTLAAGQTKSFNVTLTRTTSPNDVWQFGQLNWTDGTHVVRSPVLARSGNPIIAPELIESTRSSLSKVISVKTGFSGKMNTIYGGLKEIGRSAHNVTEAPQGSLDTPEQMRAACVAAGPGVRVVPVTVPSATLLAQFELFNRDTSSGNGNDDLDLLVLNSNNVIVDGSLSQRSDEVVRMMAPAAGNYRVCVLGYATANGSSTDFTLSSAVVTSADRGGNFRVLVPSQVYAGSTASVSASWSGLPSGKRYAGAMQLLDSSGKAASHTAFKVETNNPLPLSAPVQRAPRMHAY